MTEGGVRSAGKELLHENEGLGCAAPKRAVGLDESASATLEHHHIVNEMAAGNKLTRTGYFQTIKRDASSAALRLDSDATCAEPHS